MLLQRKCPIEGAEQGSCMGDKEEDACMFLA